MNKRSQLSVSLDAAGRIVLPKRLRDSLHLAPGESLIAEQRDDEIVIRRPTQAPGLIEDRGMLVYDNGAPPSSFDSVDWINRDRERRMAYVSGEIDEP
jgi:AbrB family looped-hinge helix DNA binding protein